MKRLVFFGLITVFLILGSIFILKKNDSSVELKSENVNLISAKNISDTPSEIKASLPIDTIWLKASASRNVPYRFRIGGALKKGDVPFKEGSFFQKNQVLLTLDLSDLFTSISKTKLLLRETLLNTLGSNTLLQTSDLFPKWNGFLNQIDITRKLPEFPEIYNAEEEQIIRKSDVAKLYVMCQQLEKNTDKYFMLSKDEGFIWDVNKKMGEQVKANEIIFSTVKKQDIIFTSSNSDQIEFSGENYTLFNENEQKIGTIQLVDSEKNTFKLSSLTHPSKGFSPDALYFIKLDDEAVNENESFRRKNMQL
jgi:hypothetical protein